MVLWILLAGMTAVIAALVAFCVMRGLGCTRAKGVLHGARAAAVTLIIVAGFYAATDVIRLPRPAPAGTTVVSETQP